MASERHLSDTPRLLGTTGVQMRTPWEHTGYTGTVHSDSMGHVRGRERANFHCLEVMQQVLDVGSYATSV